MACGSGRCILISRVPREIHVGTISILEMSVIVATSGVVMERKS